ncbi:MAG: GNAT family N-acetyltransferase [Bacteroidota bacterium]
MKIENCTIQDIDEIFRLYRIATEYQKPRFSVYWPEFERSLVETEIHENRQWKLLIDGTVACIWAISFSDPQIWEERNADPAIYIHRIATNPDYRGRNFVADIVVWAKDYAQKNNKLFIRLDTIGNNEKLIRHYTNAGFDYLGLFKLQNTDGLPQHYHNASACLFEIKLAFQSFNNHP